MVKLGSIYGEGGQGGRMRAPEEIQEKLDFNHWIQERRMVAQDRKQWEKESPDQQELEVLSTLHRTFICDRCKITEISMITSRKEGCNISSHSSTRTRVGHCMIVRLNSFQNLK